MSRNLLLLSLLFFFSCASPGETLCDASGKPFRRGGRFDPAPVVFTPAPMRKGEFHGVWIAIVGNRDFPLHSTVAEFRKHFCTMADQAKAAGINAIVFQVRSHCDAFYPSALAPWSRWLTGAEGRGLAPSFDPLAFMVTETHRRGMEFHAWLNPYRVSNDVKGSKAAYLKTLDPGNFARKHPEYVLFFPGKEGKLLFLDPGQPAVVTYLTQVVEEILRHYPVDAIHFDDYFYPYEEIGPLDNASYHAYNPSRLNKADWRRSNTDALISGIHAAIDRHNRKNKRHVRFGISPFGIWRNRISAKDGSPTGGKESYSTLYADSRKWVKKGWIDYVAPQIYWNFGHEKAAYAGLVDWWCSVVKGTGVKLYIGQASYRAGEAGWGPQELANQLRFNRSRAGVDGSVFFSWRSLFVPPVRPGAKNLLKLLKSPSGSGR